MDVVLNKTKTDLRSVKDIRDQFVTFSLPNPGDVFMLAAFLWSALCFVLVVFGDGNIGRSVVQLARSDWMREILLTDQTAIAGVMLVGFLAIALLFFFYQHYKYLTIGLLFWALISQDTRAPVYHEIAFSVKYTLFVYLAIYGVVFLAKNIWRILGAKYYRLLMLWIGWLAFVMFLKGVVIGNIWYLATDFIVVVSIGMAWLSFIETREDLLRFNIILSEVAVVMTVIHLTSPLWGIAITEGVRFQSLFNGATGFSHVYSLQAICLFWRSMYETRPMYKRVFTALAVLGFVMILVSGTRAAAVSLLLGIGFLWYVFRTRIFVYCIAAAFVGLLVQIFLAGDADLQTITSRMQSLENTRLELWGRYFAIYLDNPIVGVSWAGLTEAWHGAKGAYYAQYMYVRTPSVHNGYLGVAVRWGSVGLILYLAIYFSAFTQASRVLLSSIISDEDKRVYILPVTMLFMISMSQLFEDTIGGGGRGNLFNVVFGAMPIIIYVYGGKLLDRARALSSDQVGDINSMDGAASART